MDNAISNLLLYLVVVPIFVILLLIYDIYFNKKDVSVSTGNFKEEHDEEKEVIQIGIVEKDKDNKYTIPVIDVTDYAEIAKKDLLTNCEKFLTYDEIKKIDESERYQLLEELYNSWYIHGIPESIKKKYSKYDDSVLQEIHIREMHRFNIRVTVFHYKYMTESSSKKDPYWFFLKGDYGTTFSGDGVKFIGAHCSFNDLLELTLTNELDYYTENGKLAAFDITPLFNGLIEQKNQKPIKFYHNHEIHIMNKKEFNKYSKQHNLQLYIDSQDVSQEMWKIVLNNLGVEFDENEFITKKFFQEKMKEAKEKLKEKNKK